MSLSKRAVKRNGRGRPTGGGKLPYAAAPLMVYFFRTITMVDCWVILAPPFDFNGASHRRRRPWPCQHSTSSGTGTDGPQAAVDYRMRRRHGYHVSLFFLFCWRLDQRLGAPKKKGSDVELGGSRKNWKVTKTKDLDMVKNFFLLTCRWSLKFKNGAGRTLFMCRNWYKTYNTIGFVPGGNIFHTVCTTQDENQSVTHYRTLIKDPLLKDNWIKAMSKGSISWCKVVQVLMALTTSFFSHTTQTTEWSHSPTLWFIIASHRSWHYGGKHSLLNVPIC